MQVLSLHQYPPAAMQSPFVVQRVTLSEQATGGGDDLIARFSAIIVPSMMVSELIDDVKGCREDRKGYDT